MEFSDLKVNDPQTQWDRFDHLLWYHKDLGIWLDVSRMNLTAENFNSIEPKIQLAYKSMSSLEGGSIANKDENRQVGHYWLRNPSLAPDQDISRHIDSEINSIISFGENIIKGKITNINNKKYTDVLWIGIGGSGLGPKLLVNSLQELEKGLEFHFIDNIDPKGINETLTKIRSKLATTLLLL
tara:strand:- start:34 stop:582 length:549 start_codon:yes stop_codon:yes gene_type:complete